MFTILGNPVRLFGALAASPGDTPGVHKFYGYKEGVGAAIRFCRNCMASQADINTKVCTTSIFNQFSFKELTT